MRPFRTLALALVLALCLASIRPSAQSNSTIALLDRYAAGEFTQVAAALADVEDSNGLLKDLRRDADGWMNSGGSTDRDRRELAAATFALEAARAGEWREWKWLQRQSDGPLPVLYWKAPPLIIEWACELLRKDKVPRPIERIWQLAAMAVAQRGEDTQFLIGFTDVMAPEVAAAPQPPASPPRIPGMPGLPGIRLRPSGPMEVLNQQKEIGHLNHVVERFPAEKRFMLGEAIARERVSGPDGLKIYAALADDPAVGGEATVRLGGLYLRLGRVPDALAAFDRAETLTRDTDLIYLARFFRGQALLRSRREADAIAAFRAALAARPGSQSASVALAPLLVQAGNRAEAQALLKAVLDAGRRYGDPYIEYVHGDDRFWTYLIARLRQGIKP